MTARPAALGKEAGRIAFGGDPAGYAQARPPYPPALFAELARLIDLSGARLFEIGPGTGLATRPLLAMGPAHHLAIEPDARLAEWLARACADLPVRPEIRVGSFEDTPLAAERFDFGCAATAFHWLDEDAALARVLAALKPGGLWAMWWNVYGDPDTPGPLQQAAQPLFAAIATTPSSRGGPRAPFGLDAPARLAALGRAGFVDTGSWRARWTVRQSAAQARALAATYSGVAMAPPDVRAAFLDALEALVHTRFGGHVEQAYVTALYWGRKPRHQP